MPKHNVLVEVGDKEIIDRAVKRFKTRIEKIGVLRKVRSKIHYVKPSVKKRDEKMKAIHRQKMALTNA